MSQHPSDLEFQQTAPAAQAQPQKSWFGRNWFWFVPVLILLPVLCCCGGGGILAWWGIGQIKDLAPYADTIDAVEKDPQIEKALGAPVEVETVMGIPAGGDFDVQIVNGKTRFEAQVPVHGSTASGTLVIKAESIDGETWTYIVRELRVDDGTVIDMMPEDQKKPPASNDPAPKNESPDKAGPGSP